MASNSNLGAARAAKQDEFYTRRQDIENELAHYSSHFLDKVVYCNCDDPVTSEFWQFFIRNFMAWGIKKLIATHYETNEQNYSYKLEMEADKNGQFSMYNEPKRMPILCNGDFRSAACIEILKEADIVVTNPPFSLFREYVAQLIEYDKRFIIIGPPSGVKYKETFPYIRDNKIWLGYKSMSADMYFRVPDDYKDWLLNNKRERSGYVIIDGEVMGRTQAIWFTNLDIPKRHVYLDLRGNYYYGNENKYPRYTNFNGIDVNRIEDIPCDYDGCMGVPISYMERYNPDQFEIIGLGEGDLAKEIGITRNDEGRTKLEYKLTDGSFKRPYARLVIRRRKGEGAK